MRRRTPGDLRRRWAEPVSDVPLESSSAQGDPGGRRSACVGAAPGGRRHVARPRPRTDGPPSDSAAAEPERDSRASSPRTRTCASRSCATIPHDGDASGVRAPGVPDGPPGRRPGRPTRPGCPRRGPVRALPRRRRGRRRPRRGRPGDRRTSSSPRWMDLRVPVALELVECWDRDVARSVERYVVDLMDRRTEITVVLPRRDFARLTQRLLHDRTSRSIARALGRYEHVDIAVVPYYLGRRLRRRRSAPSARRASTGRAKVASRARDHHGLRPRRHPAHAGAREGRPRGHRRSTRTPRRSTGCPPGSRPRTIVGLGFDREVLEEAGIKDADAFLAVSSGDNSNIVSARVAREHYHVPKVIARIYDPMRADIYEKLNIPTVSTTRWGVKQMKLMLSHTGEEIKESFAGGDLFRMRIEVPAAPGREAGLRPSTSRGRSSSPASTEAGKGFIPMASSTFQEGDVAASSFRRTPWRRSTSSCSRRRSTDDARRDHRRRSRRTTPRGRPRQARPRGDADRAGPGCPRDGEGMGTRRRSSCSATRASPGSSRRPSWTPTSSSRRPATTRTTS